MICLHFRLYPHCVPRWFDTYVIELTKLIVRIRGNLSKLERKVIVALVTTDVHARDIIDELYENKVQTHIQYIDMLFWGALCSAVPAYERARARVYRPANRKNEYDMRSFLLPAWGANYGVCIRQLTFHSERIAGASPTSTFPQYQQALHKLP